MKFAQIAIPFAIVALAAAKPLSRRQDDAFSTTTDVVIETVWTIVTVWVDPTPTPTDGLESINQPTVDITLPQQSVLSTTSAQTQGTATATTSSSDQVEYTGDMTYYDVSIGAGSCGWQGSNSQNLVALAADVMQNPPNPNDNPKCGETINMYYGGNTHQATVYDTCPTCDGGSIDVTQQLFEAIAPEGNGRVHDVSWDFA